MSREAVRAATQRLAELRRAAQLAEQDHVNARIERERRRLNPRNEGRGVDVGSLTQPPKPWWGQ